MWRIIDFLLYLLFGAKKFEFTPAPDDWPPDGSMAFKPYPPPEYEALPVGFLYYEFGPGCDEDDPVAIALSKQIIELFCQSRTVLTVLNAYTSYDGRLREIPPRFVYHYSDLLKSKQPEIPVYQEGGKKLVYLTTGYDKELLPIYYASLEGSCGFSFYLFSPDEPLTDAKQAWEKAKAYQYAFKLDYIDHGPSSLEVCVNPEIGDIEDIRKAIEQICAQNDVLLVQ